MIHLPTAAGGRVEHLVRLGQPVHLGQPLARVHPVEGPTEEICAPLDGVVARQRLQGQEAPRYARIVGLTRVVLATMAGRIRWIATLGPVDTTVMVALIEAGGIIRPLRAGIAGFVGQRYCRPGERVVVGQPLLEIRGEELV